MDYGMSPFLNPGGIMFLPLSVSRIHAFELRERSSGLIWKTQNCDS